MRKKPRRYSSRFAILIRASDTELFGDKKVQFDGDLSMANSKGPETRLLFFQTSSFRTCQGARPGLEKYFFFRVFIKGGEMKVIMIVSFSTFSNTDVHVQLIFWRGFCYFQFYFFFQNSFANVMASTCLAIFKNRPALSFEVESFMQL